MAAPVPFSWVRGEVPLDVLLGVVLLAAAYTWAGVASRRPAPLGPPLAFFAGCAALLTALNGPLHDLSDYYLFSAHMVQHLVLTLVVPPLWLAGTPGWMLDALVARAARARRVAPVLRWLTRPLPASGTAPLPDLSPSSLSPAHLVPPLVLPLVAPPLWLAGTPGWMLDALVARAARARRVAPVLRWLTRPLPAFAAFGVALVAGQ